jgi:hypothetical protein
MCVHMRFDGSQHLQKLQFACPGRKDVAHSVSQYCCDLPVVCAPLEHCMQSVYVPMLCTTQHS